jgi:hypothetical protein
MPELNTRMGRGSQAGQLLKSDVLRHFCHLLLAVLCAAARDNRRLGAPAQQQRCRLSRYIESRELVAFR